MQLRTEIDIQASPREVWEVLTNFRAYPEWNPFITSIRGKARVGEELHIVISPPQSREMRFRPKVLRVEPDRELRWRGVIGFEKLFAGEHFFRLSETGAGGTRFAHGEDFSGWLLKITSLTQTARGFVFMNQALKRRVESLRL